jgi:protein gp37
MFREKSRFDQDPSVVVRSSERTFQKPIRMNREAEEGIRTDHNRLVFTCSWSDFFHEDADPWRHEAWEVIRNSPGLIFQILTKRPDRALDYLPPFWDEIRDRIWFGVTVEDKDSIWRLSFLRRFRVPVKFVSVEPLIGPLILSWFDRWERSKGKIGFGTGNGFTCLNCGEFHQKKEPCSESLLKGTGPSCDEWKPIDWIIIGGESGTPDQNVRVMHPWWVDSLINFGNVAEIPVFFKQWGEWSPVDLTDPEERERAVKGGKNIRWMNVTGTMKNKPPKNWESMPSWVPMERTGRVKSGSEFYGSAIEEMPQIPGFQPITIQEKLI